MGISLCSYFYNDGRIHFAQQLASFWRLLGSDEDRSVALDRRNGQTDSMDRQRHDKSDALHYSR
jgi:hypothetical protein